MKQWQFGIVGAGLIADFHARAIADIPNARLRGVFDSIPERAKALAEKHNVKAYDSIESFLADGEIDVVTIATPSGSHLEPAVAAAKAGKHVICEKPLEITLDRVDAMIAAHQAAGTKLGGVFQNRFTGAMAPLRAAIQAGRFGTLSYAGVYVPWWREDSYYAGSWRGTWKLDGGGALMNQSIHMIDMLCDLMPPVEAVQAFTGTLAHPQIETEDTAVGVVRFAGGALGVIYGTTASWPGQFKRFEITGNKGTAIYLEDSFTVWQFADESPEDERVRSEFGYKPGGAGAVADPAAIGHVNHTRNFKSFLDSLDGQGGMVIDGTEARKSVSLILAVYESAKTGRMITL